jgi:two-component system sensor histidine kinase EvgS
MSATCLKGKQRGERPTERLESPAIGGIRKGIMAKILIVDDDRNARTLLVVLLEFEGHTMVACDNGADGLQAAERQDPALVISATRMPGLTGQLFISA